MLAYYCSNLTKQYQTDIYNIESIFPADIYEQTQLETIYQVVVSTSNLSEEIAGYPELIALDRTGPIDTVREKTADEKKQDHFDTKIQLVREERDIRLNLSDKYMLEDYPIKSTKELIITYRQQLRDLPASLDLNTIDTFTWPVNPEA